MFDDGSKIVKLFGLSFNVGNCVAGLVTAIIVCAVLIWLSRNLQMKPTGKQNILEWIVDFTNGIVKSAIPSAQGSNYGLLAFLLFVFIFVANQLGLIIQFVIGDVTYIKSPTASPMTTLTLAFMVLVISHIAGVNRFGFKGYVKNTFLSPMPVLFPIKILEQFTNFITLALRLYGNIYAGEVLLKLVFQMAQSHGILTFIPAMPLEMIWQGFSVFIGAIQAYVFVTLAMVYISQKVEKEA
ncbi:F0F1 ATP synthase subunit A [Ligilactobacillus aviarius]|uniref:ATP synthase subunit a n=1 Tax=Ligilactobacillus aviarius TaxID=1606 RepID=A0A510WTW4_9LACO|nr:F0F1 ATP synthase subunit A [Ligilactobacillus aviarius]HJD08997.1 F0F1 ATP synthase subunit A [Candidatus Ligilactobacillus faecavium]KRM39660.1 atp synthase subunit a [Ligilactobacillus aviarius subsp. aviarius DSM 20655]MBM6862524.1 F0F1 ATP synthase subunit A [Ligilactobacillus aviarius]MDM8278438.1 F0F1 ATP synthase subunit A [Ligilactobacillus aviarius]GEK42041.1 ATP synthase subunit a [Ligilactobacillus aviarius]